ncbi:TRAP transporter substrate-binding protein [Anianabacter salinae]|uniref:TRAP transporter substrate-binding protein n=1 Tax=Anianabacter salinae TaxID=2851023 RepID=UPI00225E21A4|nr:TRAP transporter substrate-binding protein [Anianabacter salinae]MBV0913830.1 TRAP transporter substrate-binding protein [Anianabacter salinae]
MTPAHPFTRRGFLGTAAATAGVLAAPATLRAQTVNLRLHHFNSPLSISHTQFLVPWAERLAEATDGELQIQIFPSMQLGGSPGELYSQAKDGIVDMVWTIPGYTANRFTLTEVFELPFVAKSATATAPAVHEFAKRNLGEEYGDTHPILFHTHAPGQLHGKGDPIRTVDDMAGLQIRGPSRPITEAIKTMGAVPVGMPVPAVTEAIARGVVDGAALPWTITRPIRLHEVTDYHTVLDFYAAVFGMVMNKSRWESLPADMQQAINDASSAEFVRELGVLWDGDEEQGRQLAIDAGNEIVEVSDAERDRFREACQPVIDNWIANVNDRGLDGQALYDEALALIEQNAA